MIANIRNVNVFLLSASLLTAVVVVVTLRLMRPRVFPDASASVVALVRRVSIEMAIDVAVVVASLRVAVMPRGVVGRRQTKHDERPTRVKVETPMRPVWVPVVAGTPMRRAEPVGIRMAVVVDFRALDDAFNFARRVVALFFCKIFCRLDEFCLRFGVVFNRFTPLGNLLFVTKCFFFVIAVECIAGFQRTFAIPGAELI